MACLSFSKMDEDDLVQQRQMQQIQTAGVLLSCAEVPSVDESLWDNATPCIDKIASEPIHSFKIMIF